MIRNFFFLVINSVIGWNSNLPDARKRIGNILHTLQDFYTHSNWIEMGNTEINNRIGLQEDIGSVADRDEPTCARTGCKKIVTKCVCLLDIFVYNN